MKAWTCEQPNGPQALLWKDLPTPPPAPGEVRVTIDSASLNFPDLLMVQGKYQVAPALPFIPGAEFSGVIDALGDGVTRLHEGDRVAAFTGTGAFATHCCVPADRVFVIPAAMSFEAAAAFLCTYGTAHHALVDRAALQAGQTVLVLGAAGGVGSAAVQVAKAMRAHVIAATSSDDKCSAAIAAGADATINYHRSDLRTELRALTGGRGPDLVFDPVGGDLSEPAFRSIAWRGCHLVIGFAAGGAIPRMPLNLALLKGTSIVGVFWGEFARREPMRHAQAVAELLRWHAEGRLAPVIDRCLPMSELVLAYDLIGSRAVRGKLVLHNH